MYCTTILREVPREELAAEPAIDPAVETTAPVAEVIE